MNCAARVRGAGVVCALGVGTAAVLDRIGAGREFDAFAGPSSSRAAYPAPFDAARDLPRGLGRRLGRQLAMSLAAVLEAVGPRRAWRDDPSDTGIVAASAHGPIHETADFIAGALPDAARYASPLAFSGAQHNAMVGVAARELGIRGPAIVVSNGDASFETALLVAVAGLSAGRMRCAVVVGADAFHELHARALAQFGLVSDSAAPIDPAMRRTTRGFHLGEGAGALLLEWGPRDACGVYVDDVRLGRAALNFAAEPERVEVMASGDAGSVRRHAAVAASTGAAGARVAHPAARFGAFASLSAVAIAVEAARRLDCGGENGATRFVSAPPGGGRATVVLSGTGRG